MASSALLSILSAYPRTDSPLPPLDDQLLVVHAAQHGLAGLVRHLLRARGEVPAAVDAGLRRQALSVAGQVERVRSLLLRALDGLAQEQVVACPLKGYWLGARLYPDAAQRYTYDVDLLVPPRQLAAAERGLVRAGLNRKDVATEAAERRRHHHLTFEDKASGGTVELHFKLSTAFGLQLEAAPFLERARSDLLEGRPVWTLAPEEELLFLAVHATQSRLLRLAWLFDLKLLCRQGLDWGRFVQRARDLGAAGPAFVSLFAAQRFLQAEVPGHVLQALRPARWRQALLNRLYSAQRLETSAARDEEWTGILALVLSSSDLSGTFAYLRQMSVTVAQRRLAHHLPSVLPEVWRA